MLPDIELAWLGGIFDGEGSCRIYKNAGGKNYFAQVQAVSNTDMMLIERVKKDLGEMGIGYSIRYTNGNKPKSKPWWSVCADVRLCNYRHVFDYLEAILPFITGKRKAQAEHVMAFVRMRLLRGNPGKAGRKPEWSNQDESFYQNQPFARGREPRVN